MTLVQFDLRLRVHGREEPAVSDQSVPDCRREQTFIRRGIIVLCELGNMLSRAPALKIGLVNDIVCGLIYVNICQ